jgi:hypothetical protein
MFTLRHLLPVPLSRCNATLQAPLKLTKVVHPLPSAKSPSRSSVSEKSTAQGTRFGRTTQGGTPGSRPRISLGRAKITVIQPHKWNRPLAPGVLPAYDEALKLIRRDSLQLKRQMWSLRKAIVKADNAPEKDNDAMRAMRQQLDILAVQSEVNLPDVRWNCANGMGRSSFALPQAGLHSSSSLADLSNPAHRHLLEQRWRQEGALDLLVSWNSFSNRVASANNTIRRVVHRWSVFIKCTSCRTFCLLYIHLWISGLRSRVLRWVLELLGNAQSVGGIRNPDIRRLNRECFCCQSRYIALLLLGTFNLIALA